MKVSFDLLCLSFFFSTELAVLKTNHVGEVTEVNDSTMYPFFVQLRIDFNSRRVACGGSLIHPEWILTAGHCFSSNQSQMDWMLENEMGLVLMGTVIAYDNIKGVSNSLAEVHCHPEYQKVLGRSYHAHDIAVGKLKRPYRLTKSIQTISLSNFFGDCTYGTVVGVGITKEGDNYTPYDVVRFYEAAMVVNNTINRETKLDSTFYIVYSSILEKGLVSDSGAPFLCNFSSSLVQVGVVSTAVDVHELVVNIVQRVDLHTEFILDHVPNVRLEYFRKPRESSILLYTIILILTFIYILKTV